MDHPNPKLYTPTLNDSHKNDTTRLLQQAGDQAVARLLKIEVDGGNFPQGGEPYDRFKWMRWLKKPI